MAEVHHEIDCTRIAMNPKFKGLEASRGVRPGVKRGQKQISTWDTVGEVPEQGTWEHLAALPTSV